MRILVVSAYFETHRGGIEIIAGALAKQLCRAKQIVTWMAAGSDPVPDNDLSGRRVPLSVFNGTEKFLGFPLPIPGVDALRAIRREVAASDAVMMHDALYPANIATFLFARWYGKPVVLTQHIDSVPYANPLLRILMRCANRLVTRPILAAAEQVVFMSKLTAEKFKDIAFRRPAVLVFSGVDTEVFRPARDMEEREAIRREFGIPSGRPVALFVGRFVEKKGLHILREAAAAGQEITWVLAGWGPIHPKEWGLSNVHVIAGAAQAQLAPLYRACDVFVLPSVGEGFPLVLQEAAVCGLPAVCGADTARADTRLAPMLYPVAVEDRAADDAAREVLIATRRALAEHESVHAPLRAALVSGWYSWEQGTKRYLELFADVAAVAANGRASPGMLPSAWRYLLVGLTCALLHNAIMIGGDLAGMHYVASNTISFVTVTSFAFMLHSYFTYVQSPSVKSFFRYIASMAANFPLSIALMFVFCDLAKLSVPVAAPLATVLLFVWNFAASRWAILGTAKVTGGYGTSAGRS